MKPDIHPVYYKGVHVKCACGATFTIGSTREKFSVEICSACHPFYTGKQKLIDTAGRVDKFMARQRVAARKQAEFAERESKRARVKVETVEEKIIRKVQEQEAAKGEVKAMPEPMPEPVEAPKPVVAKRKATKKAIAKKPVAKKAPTKKAKAPVAKKTAAKKAVAKKGKK